MARVVRNALVLAAFGLALPASPGLAQGADDGDVYRQGMPAVLTPAVDGEVEPRPEREAMLQGAFASAYRGAGSPRLAILWNRDFSDRLREMDADLRVVQRRSEGLQTEGADGVTRVMGGGEAVVSVEVRRDERRQPLLSERERFLFETGYARSFLEAGAALVDRSTVMRLTHAEGSGSGFGSGTNDRQLVETEALRGYADLIVEILATPSAEADLGTAYQVTVIDVGTGAIRAVVFRDANFGAGEEKWTAVRGGYIRVAEKREVDYGEIGRLLALHTMEALALAWN